MRLAICADRHDHDELRELRAHLATLVRRHLLELWDFDLGLLADKGLTAFSAVLREHLDGADLLVLLLSADYLASDEFEAMEPYALLRHRQGAVVIPVIVRACTWDMTALAELQALPSNGRPVASWPNRDDAWQDVVQGIRRALKFSDIARPQPSSPPPPPVAVAPPAEALPIDRIFQVKGQPLITYVEPSQSAEIRGRLQNMGHGLIVEGPSGSGKTTAVRKALEAMQVRPIWLVASRDDDIARLRAILQGYFAEGGHLVVDDFHRLERPLQQRVADLIKIVADENRHDAKITLIGINPVGASLVKGFPDLANRFATVSMGRQPDEKIDELIVKGERAANIVFRRRPELVQEAAGSFFTAQLLCYETSLKEGVLGTQPELRYVETGPAGYVIDKVQQSLAFKYHDLLLAFASCDERPPPRGACLALLWMLLKSSDRSVSLATARYRYPTLADAFDWLMASNLSRRFEEIPRLSDLFYYNRDAAVLSLEDPQLEFYLRHLRWGSFARDSGHERARWDVDAGPIFDGGPHVSSSVEATSELAGQVEASALPESFVLHLSDLHFGTGEQASIWSNQLIQDLRLDLGMKRIDAVIVSGDIANRATPEEYQAARKFFFDLKQELRLSPQHIVLVPGNHDLGWDASRRSYTPKRRADHTGPLQEGEFIDGGDYIEVRDDERYVQRFSSFASFHHDVRLEPYPLEYDKQASLHFLQAQRLLILGLNSAWSLDHHYRDRAGINGVALGQALRLVRSTAAYVDCLKIAVWHHPVHSSGEDRIKDTGFLELLAQAGFRVGLHGHIHKAQEELFHYDMLPGGRRIALIAAGTFGAPTHEWVPGYPLQYQLLHISGRKMTVHTRCREKPGGAWRPDARWLRGPGRDPASRYDVDV